MHCKEQPHLCCCMAGPNCLEKTLAALKSGLCPFLGAHLTESLSQWPEAALGSCPSPHGGCLLLSLQSQCYCGGEGSLRRLIWGCCPWAQTAAAGNGISACWQQWELEIQPTVLTDSDGLDWGECIQKSLGNPKTSTSNTSFPE